MTNEKNFDSVENLHIGNVYHVSPGLNNPLEVPENRKPKFQTQINVIHITEPVKTQKQSPISDDEKDDYAEYMKKLRSHSSYRGEFKG